jgi:hypothetical protein
VLLPDVRGIRIADVRDLARDFREIFSFMKFVL